MIQNPEQQETNAAAIERLMEQLRAELPRLDAARRERRRLALDSLEVYIRLLRSSTA